MVGWCRTGGSNSIGERGPVGHWAAGSVRLGECERCQITHRDPETVTASAGRAPAGHSSSSQNELFCKEKYQKHQFTKDNGCQKHVFLLNQKSLPMAFCMETKTWKLFNNSQIGVKVDTDLWNIFGFWKFSKATKRWKLREMWLHPSNIASGIIIHKLYFATQPHSLC